MKLLREAAGRKSCRVNRLFQERPRMDSILARISRRRMLQVGSLGLTGISLPAVLRADFARARGVPRARADSCILVFLDGGPSHLDMWDMKLNAPAEIRGEFAPIASSLPGVP